MKICISAESTIDLTKELKEQFDIKTIPFSIVLGGEIHQDGVISNQDIFNFAKESGTLPKTTAINSFEYETYFKELLKNYDYIIHISLSSEISSTCRNAMLAAGECDGKVFVVNSRTLSTGIALLAMYGCDLVKQGLSAEEIAKKLQERTPNVQASFVIKQLDYLYKGGRCSRLAMFGANIFHICPQIVVKDGKMGPGKKYRGVYKKVVLDYVDDTLNEFNNPDLERVFITYPSLDDENDIVSAIKEKLVARGFKNIYTTYAGGTITCHCGPNTIGILYFNN